MSKTDDLEGVLWIVLAAVVGLLVYRCSGFYLQPTMLPFVKMAMAAVGALIGFISFSAQVETKFVADLAVRATPVLFGLAALAVVIGILMGKVNEAVVNLPTLLG